MHMKKYALFSYVFILSIILLGSFGVKSANAWDSGCTSAGPYSTTTGQLCSTTTTTPVACAPGDNFSYLTGAPCKGTTTTTPPTISGVSGPQTLNVNQQGTWTVNASDSSSWNLSYSVQWGDGTHNLSNNSATAWQASQYATLTHTYTVAGTYTPTFTVTDSNGLTAQTSLTVVVGNTTTTSTITVTSPAGGEQWAQGTTHTISWTDSSIRPVLCPSQPVCTPGTACPMYRIACPIAVSNTYDISLQTGYSAQSIATRVFGTSYNWTIPISLALGSTYSISVCRTGTNICGFQNTSFSIISGTTTQSPTVFVNETSDMCTAKNNSDIGATSSMTCNITYSVTNNGISVYVLAEPTSPTANTNGIAYSVVNSAGTEVVPSSSLTVFSPTVGSNATFDPTQNQWYIDPGTTANFTGTVTLTDIGNVNSGLYKAYLATSSLSSNLGPNNPVVPGSVYVY
jgi:hypothetical protein